MFVVFAAVTAGAQAEDAASVLFESSRSHIVQVLIMEVESDKKAAIGSGFRVGDAGVIATNFHVISEAVHDPEGYRVEVLDGAGERTSAKIVHFDVIHDLALVRTADTPEGALQVSGGALTKGQTVFALGNPFDLGQTIVPGTFNGLLETSFYQKLLFSGSLNPGMSGGPALNAEGRVVGVNVATSGNQISFLVPVKYLVALIERAAGGAALEADAYETEIGRQLMDDQAYKYDLLLNLDWPTQKLGSARVGADVSDYFKCWGDTHEDDDALHTVTETMCTSQDSIYISAHFQTGAIDYQYTWAQSDQLGDLRFSAFVGQSMGSMYTRNLATEEDVTNYQCHQSFVEDAHGARDDWRTVFCVRRYKAYPDLFDVLYLSTLFGESTEALSSHFALSGVSMDNALQFLRKFTELQSWDS